MRCEAALFALAAALGLEAAGQRADALAEAAAAAGRAGAALTASRRLRVVSNTFLLTEDVTV